MELACLPPSLTSTVRIKGDESAEKCWCRAGRTEGSLLTTRKERSPLLLSGCGGGGGWWRVWMASMRSKKRPAGALSFQ